MAPVAPPPFSLRSEGDRDALVALTRAEASALDTIAEAIHADSCSQTEVCTAGAVPVPPAPQVLTCACVRVCVCVCVHFLVVDST